MLLMSKKFPNRFLWGVSSSSYQTEGAWNVDGKGVNIWDTFCHKTPSPICDGATGDDACNGYYRTDEIVKIIKNLGVSIYRFSISWARILPNGELGTVNQNGIDHYDSLINDLLANGIEPVTLEDQGGWLNEKMVDWFSDYAKICFESYSKKVKYWITINEPREIAWSSYGDGFFAPGMMDRPGEDPYTVGHNLLKAHAKAYRLYEKEFKKTKNAKIGMACSAYWFKPESDSESDLKAARLKSSFDCDWFIHALFANGDYPDLMKQHINEKSRIQKYPKSRLPQFTQEEKKIIKGSADFLCLNYYTSKVVRHLEMMDANYASDPDCFVYQPDTWKGCVSPWLKFCPWGLSNLLHYLKDTYRNVPVLITENGCSDDGSTLEDHDRVEYIKTHLEAVHEAIANGCNIVGYMFWSLLDNFEWTVGYTERFGLYHVDFKKENKPITPKLSSEIYANIVKNNEVI